MDALKLTHGIEMIRLLRDQGKGDKVVRIENEYARDFTAFFMPRKKNK